jgi:hypothetical protein
MRVTPFTRDPRNDQSGYRQKEPRFEYLDRSARPEARAIRRRIVRWLADYPDQHRLEWIARFSSGDDVAYSSAFFELYLYTYFLRSGFAIEVAPGSEGGSLRAPDFRLSQGEIAFYLEATTAHDQDPTDLRVAKWKAEVRGRIDGVSSKHFFVSLEWQRDPKTQPAPSKSAGEVEQWLRTLDYGELRRRYERSNRFLLPTLTIRAGGGLVRVLAVPRNKPRVTHGLLGSEGFGLQGVDVSGAIQTALRKKSSRYGDLGAPYMVAINLQSTNGEEDEILDALVGTRESGLGDARHPRARGVSAVLCVRDINPWTIGQEAGRRQMYVAHNPNARFPLPIGITHLAERWLDDYGALNGTKGRDVRRRLNIPRDWPEVR